MTDYTTYLDVIIVLLVLHYIADFGLQPDGVVTLKRDSSMVLLGHAFLCGFLPYLVYKNVYLCLTLSFAHLLVDFAKIDGGIGVDDDQWYHIISVVVIGFVFVWTGALV